MSSLDSNTSTIDHKRLPVIDEIESDSDSVIQLDSSFDSLRSKDNSLVSNNSLTIKSRRTQCSPHILCSRQLQRSILDVVDLWRRLVKDYKDTSPFFDFIYRGFLLRQQRRQKDYSPDLTPPPIPSPISISVRCGGSGRHQTPRSAKNKQRRQKTIIFINQTWSMSNFSSQTFMWRGMFCSIRKYWSLSSRVNTVYSNEKLSKGTLCPSSFCN